MIPKTIHYCWFGGKPLPELAVKCIESWKKFCPDYEIVRWDESNFDINACPYVREAYEAGKYAFVSDYARLKVLVENGGMYMDTDVEVLKPLDKFMNGRAFSGFETEKMISTGIMACEKGFAPFSEMLREYDTRHFSLGGGSFDLTTNVKAITDYWLRRGLVQNNTEQTINGFTIYPKDYFCPKNHITMKIEMTENTCTIHHFAATWLPPYKKFKQKIKKILGYRLNEKIVAVKNFFRKITGRLKS